MSKRLMTVLLPVLLFMSMSVISASPASAGPTDPFTNAADCGAEAQEDPDAIALCIAQFYIDMYDLVQDQSQVCWSVQFVTVCCRMQELPGSYSCDCPGCRTDEQPARFEDLLPVA